MSDLTAEELKAHIRRLSGCLLVIAGAQGVSEASLRNVAYEATQGAGVETVARRLGVTMPLGWVAERPEPTGASAASVGSENGMLGGEG